MSNDYVWYHDFTKHLTQFQREKEASELLADAVQKVIYENANLEKDEQIDENEDEREDDESARGQ